MLWHSNGKKPEMSLQSWVHDEGTSSWVHGGAKLGVLDILQGELALVVPMLVVSVLSQESDSVLGVVWIPSWHVQVINEIDELSSTLWSIQSTSLLLEVLLEDHLSQVGIRIEVEVDDLMLVSIRLGADIGQETLDDLGLTTSSLSNQDWGVVHTDELVHQVRSRDCVHSWDGVS